MSAEIPSVKEKSTASLLKTDKWYPVLSSLSIHGEDPTTFWVSEQPEYFMTPLDQSEAQCYRVDFIPEKHATSGNSVIGRVATMGPETRIQLLFVGGSAYVGNRDIMTAKYEEERARRRQEKYGEL